MTSNTPKNKSVTRSQRSAFTLIELLVVVAIMAVLMMLVAPAFTTIGRAGDVTKATYDVSGAIQTARSYATANDTYVWLGFFEEDVSSFSKTPAISGTGRIVISMVASADGTSIYDPGNLSNSTILSLARLIQVNKLIKISNMHLKTAKANDPVFPPGTGTGNAFDTRPVLSGSNAQIGDTPADSTGAYLFQYPVAAASTAQYKFNKTLQFNPRGEGILIVNNIGYPLTPVMEVGLQSTHGTVPDTINKNVAAVQVTGVGGNVTTYRR